jgi:plasmid replication initiation protein
METKDINQAIAETVCSKMVVKANDLIQKSQFDLSLLQQKVVLFLISQLKTWDEDFKLYEFSIADFCKACCIDYKSGKNYSMLKSAIKEIADKSIWVTLENGKHTLVRWIEKPYINEQSGTIQIRLDNDMKPYLLQLQDNFTQYELVWALQFKRKYSVRLYELAKSIHYNELASYERVYELEELRKLMGAEKYNTWQTFKIRALEPAIEEINSCSDKIIEYQTITYGKVVGRVRLIIKSKEITERLELEIAHKNKFLEE